MKHVFIVNPHAGKKNKNLFWIKKIDEVARQEKIEYEIFCTEYAGHATEITQKIAKTGQEVRFYACGGDGTLYEVFFGAYKYSNAQVASVPGGSGNDYVRNFATVQDFINLQDNINGKSVKVDLIRINDKIAHDIASVGLDANVAFGMRKFKNVPLINGKLAYNLSIIQQVLKPLGQKLKITINGKTLQNEFLLTAVCNGKTYGSGIMASKYSNLSDGMLEVVIVNKISKLKIASVFSVYKSGNHLVNDTQVRDDLKDIIAYEKCTDIVIENSDGKKNVVNIDGETCLMDIINISVLKDAANFVLPLKVFNSYKI